MRTFFDGDGSVDISIISASVNSIGEKCGTESTDSGVSVLSPATQANWLLELAEEASLSAVGQIPLSHGCG